MTIAALQHALQTNRQLLPGTAKTESLRADELTSFAAKGFPDARQENWRYTDLKPIADRTFDFVPGKPSAEAIANVRALLPRTALAEDARRLVFVDGHHVHELSTPNSGLDFQLSSLADRWDLFESAPAQRGGLAGHPLASLNTAFAQQGVWIGLPEDVQVDEPIHLVFAGSGASGLALQPRVLIDLQRGARITVVEHFCDHADPVNWLNPVTQVTQAAGSELTLYRLQEHGLRQFHTALLYAELAAQAKLQVGYVDLGGRLTRNDIEVKLLEPGASVELFGVFLAAQQHIDNHTRVDHVAPATRSDAAFRGIIGRHGRGVFNGRVIVHRDAQRVDAHQSNDNLLLSELAEIDTKPELEIYADDVKCSHGTTVGELDAEQLFYLRARGIDERTARSLLTIAFADSVLDRIRLPALRARISARVVERLSAWAEVSP
ncbi:MAG TPA: Fe-S cluster assembly protein SufD [Gammaproteobacteria bacterium]|nr:Fe-S cluster assembly protein SufD [Gammaproteobacteria bacterium]